MKVLKISDNLIKGLEEINYLLKGIEHKTKKSDLIKNIDSIKKFILEIKTLYKDYLPIELTILSDLLLEMNEVLRKLIIYKLNFKDYVFALNKLTKNINQLAKDAHYDFFKLCGNCSTCCVSPHVFSFEHNFIDKYRQYLQRKGLSYEVKNNPKTGLCTLYDKTNKKCTVYHDRPIDCTFFPFSFIIDTIKGPVTAKSKLYVILSKAIECDVADRLSLNDALEALKMICFVLSKTTLEEAKQYSAQADPRKMTCGISVPYDERKMYYKALKQIFEVKLYLRKNAKDR